MQNMAAGLVLTPVGGLRTPNAIMLNLQLFGVFVFLVLSGSILAYMIWFIF